MAPEAKSHLRGSLLDFFFTYKQVLNILNLDAKEVLLNENHLECFSSFSATN